MLARSAVRAAGTAAVLALVAGACGPRPPDPPQVVFWNSIRALCGQAFEGRAVELTAVDSAVAGERLVLHVWQCYHDELRLAFHVGEDRSRVWRLTRDQDMLRILHDVHETDGSPAAITGYGGTSAGPGSASLQEFAADTETTMKIPSAAGAAWTLEIVPRERLAYTYRSPGGERFRVEFDLTAQTGRPPPPWGYTRQRRPES